MNKNAKLSVVLPVRNGQDRIASEVERVLEAMSDLVASAFEVLVVDDGSRDATAEVLDELAARFPQVRGIRHHRSLGLEAAGQTGLERARGDLVFIQEDDSPLRLEDLRQLYQMAADESVVAARAQSHPSSTNGQLLRRLRAWGARTVDSLKETNSGLESPEKANALSEPVRGLQMVRRPHLQFLASRASDQVKLETERFTTVRE